jgi:hypothetical protein
MRLTLTDAVGTVKTLRAIVDSGAAWSAIDAAALADAFPNVHVSPSTRKFRDASDRLMPLLGSVQLNFRIGDLTLSTEIFVFRKLGAPFLLGVNALHQHGLTISNYRGIIYSEKPDATAASHEPLQFAPAAPANFATDGHSEADRKCGRCLLAHVQDGSNTSDTCDLCPMCPSSDWVLVCDADGCTLKARSTSGRELHMGCERVPPFQATTGEPDANEYCASLRTRKRYVVPAGTRGFEIRLRYSTHLHGPTKSIEVALTNAFKSEYCSPTFTVLDTQLHSSMNASVPLLVSNAGSHDVVIPADLHVADAAVYAPTSARTRKRPQYYASTKIPPRLLMVLIWSLRSLKTVPPQEDSGRL